jgi:hypothetical protein
MGHQRRCALRVSSRDPHNGENGIIVRMAGTKELDPVPPTQTPDGRVPEPIETAPTLAAAEGAPENEELQARAKAIDVLPAVLAADDAERRRANPIDQPYQLYGLIAPLQTDERRKMRMLTLLEKYPFDATRLELEVLIRGGDLGPAPERVISPAAHTVEKK